MGKPIAYQPHKLFIAVLYRPDRPYESVRRLIVRHFGPVDSSLEPQPFSFSSYYDAEMGPGLQRSLFSIENLVDPSQLASLKETANRMEAATANSEAGSFRRTVNLDPGLLSLSRVILATTKASAHRIPLRDGLHAEITLLYRRGGYSALEWTYPDFRSDSFLEWLAELRRRYHEQLRELDRSHPWRL